MNENIAGGNGAVSKGIKSIEEIIRAHDLLVGIITGEVPNPAPKFFREQKLCADVLCWVLNHAHNTSFQSNLGRMERQLITGGFELKKFLDCKAKMPSAQHP